MDVQFGNLNFSIEVKLTRKCNTLALLQKLSYRCSVFQGKTRNSMPKKNLRKGQWHNSIKILCIWTCCLTYMHECSHKDNSFNTHFNLCHLCFLSLQKKKKNTRLYRKAMHWCDNICRSRYIYTDRTNQPLAQIVPPKAYQDLYKRLLTVDLCVVCRKTKFLALLISTPLPMESSRQCCLNLLQHILPNIFMRIIGCSRHIYMFVYYPKGQKINPGFYRTQRAILRIHYPSM